MKNLQAIIEQAWEERDKITLKTKGPIRKAVATALEHARFRRGPRLPRKWLAPMTRNG